MMKPFTWLCPLTACLLSAFAVAALSADDSHTTLRFRKIPLMISPNEGCAIGDVNNDGHPDIVAGTHWFAGPDFIPRPLRDIDEFQDDYLHNNGDHLWDVNGDGRLDVISGSFFPPEIYWYENPGEVGLKKGLKWKRHLLQSTRGQNESKFLYDIDGDGVPEIVVNCWIKDAPLVAWKLTHDDEGKPTLAQHVLGESGNGHGMGFGDVNGDGREDILCSVGWYERPAGDPLSTEWKLHRDWERPHGSCPMIVTDLNGDGRNDILWGNGHNYGLFWFEQLEPAADGSTQWREHLIDREWSQAHCLHWADLDGDGRNELITGKRVRGHAGRDPGGLEPECLYYYKWNPDTLKFTRYTISEGEGIGTGLQIRTADLNGNGRLDIAVSGKSGTWVLLNEGDVGSGPPAAADR